jgi:hypothetical protein
MKVIILYFNHYLIYYIIKYDKLEDLIYAEIYNPDIIEENQNIY